MIIWAVWENMEVTITKSCRLVSDHMEGIMIYDISCEWDLNDYTLFKDDTMEEYISSSGKLTMRTYWGTAE